MEFRKTERFESGIGSVNKVDPQMLYPLLERVVTKLHLQEKVLTKEEMEQFVARFKLRTEEAESLLSFCSFIFSKVLEEQASEQALARSLKDSGMGEQHCLAFATAWNREKDGVIRRIKKNNFAGGPLSLESVDWKVHVEVRGGNRQAAAEEEGSSSETRKKKNGIAPKAVLQLNLQDQSKHQAELERETKTVSVEFNREQLEKLYKNFEEIQSQLDALT